MDLISKTLHYVGKNFKDLQVIQIGAMDGINFDDTRGFLDLYKWKSLLVEPIPILYEELKSNFKDRGNYSFEQCAIADYDGGTEMLTIPPEVIKREALHPGYKGMSAMYPLRNGFGSDYQRDIDVKTKFGVNIKVPTLTFNSLLSKHNITEFDILICDAEGYDWNIFKQIDLKKYRPKFIRLEYINLTEEEKKLVADKLKENGYVVDINQDIDAVPEELWRVINLNQTSTKPQLEVQTKPLTVVTGLWNINRPGRDFNHYIENFNKLLDIDVNLFVYVPASLEHLVWAKRKKENTFVKVYELDNVKNLYSPFWDKTQKIRTDPNWFNQTGSGGWLSNSPQAVCEWYNPIVMSKMFMLHDVTIWDPFASKYFIWLDAGITNTVYEKYFTENKVLDNIGSLLDPFLFLCYPYHTNNEIHGFKKDAIDKFAQADVQLVGRGGLFGGTKQAIHEANGLYYALVDRSLSEGYMGTEESIFSIMTYLYPETYRRYMLDENGLIIKFIQELADKKPALEPIPEERTTNRHVNVDLTKVKTAIYILTFNFPQQLRTLLKSLEKYPEWLQGTEKILIDNSTDPIAKAENQKIVQEYQFIHYKHFDNIGICGGRQYAAEHFDTTDNDFYVFFEDDMCLHEPSSGTCRNGFRFHVPNLFEKIQKIMLKEKFDFLKLSFTEVYMDNHIQCSWYNVPQPVRTQTWPSYDKLPVNGLDPNTPRTEFNKINVYEELAYIDGDVYYANWPLITSKEGNRKMFLNTKWAHPYEQTWMSHMFQETRKGNMKTAVLLASPINHNRIVWYKPHERKEN